LSNEGVNVLQGMKYQILPVLKNKKHPLVRHMVGDVLNKQVYLTRNCVFEPSQNLNRDSVSDCLKNISNAFLWRKPAIITAHRLNFIGNIVESNRTKNLASLDELFVKILKKWPGVEFMTSDGLGRLILADIKNHRNF
jgi:hypothetical protein